MGNKTSLIKTIAAIVASATVTLSTATGVTVGHVLRKNANSEESADSTNTEVKEARGISSVDKTNTYGLIDEYTITYTDNTTSTFIVVNGSNGEQGIQGFPGTDGRTPEITIGDNGNWFVDGVDTNVTARGEQGPAGENGITPHIGQNGNWWIGETDTGIVAEGHNGKTPLIGANGNWWIGGTDTGVPAQGLPGNTITSGQGNPNEAGLTGNAGDVFVDVDTWDYYSFDGTQWNKLGTIGAGSGQGGQGQGGQGQQEEPVNTLRTGAGDPNVNNIEGIAGDAYIDTQTWYYYVYDGTIWTPQGKIQGEAGEPGEDGKSIYSGHGDPTTNGVEGKNGDAYIDFETGDYYTFDGTQWNLVGNIKGEQGNPGIQGASVISGTGNPTTNSVTGRNGDAYIDVESGDYYVMRDDAWELEGNIKGAQGEEGRSVVSIERTDGNGAAGTVDTYTITYSDNTTSTFTVTNGADGADLLFGTSDPDNDNDGVNGDSYINLTDWTYWVKEADEWQSKGSFRGEDGVSIRDIEKTGSEGRVDTYTITYSDDTTENPHKTSFTVTNGNTLITGTVDPTDIGNDGDSYLNTQSWEYFVKEGDAWVSKGHISGTSFKTGHGNPNDNHLSGINGDSYLDLDEWEFYSYNATDSEWEFEARLFEKYAVSFNTNGGSEAPEAQDVREGRKATKPATNPTKEGYFFQGWYTEEGNKWNFEKDVVSGDITLYAHWAQFEVTNGVLTACSATGDVVIPAYFEGQMITAIADELFKNNDNITSITLPGTVTTIGESTFEGSHIEEVILAEGLLTISDNAFQGCSSLTSIVIPNSVRTIGQGAFDSCTQLRYVAMTDTPTRRVRALEIGNGAFLGCENLLAVNLPSRVTSIGEDAFGGCSSLESLKVPFIGGSETENKTLNYLFGGMIPSSLKTVTVTGNSAINEDAFDGATNVENIIFEGNPESFAKSALHACSSLKNLEIPYVAASYNDSTTGAYLGYLFGADNYSENSSYVPASLVNVTVTGDNDIAEHAFNGCANLESIALEGNVSFVGDGAFEGCDSLKGLTLNTTYSTNFYKLFGATADNEAETYVPHSLKNVEIIDATSVPNNYFHNCAYVESVTLGENVTSIGDSAFLGCTNLKEIIIPDSVTSIGENAFAQCASLKKISLPNTLTSIGENAFRDCKLLESIVLPSGINEIPANAFNGCTSLNNVIIPENVTVIGESAFANCYSLNNLTFKGELVDLGNEAFSNCYGLNYVALPEITGTLGTGVFKGSVNLRIVVLPTSLTSIPDTMFEGCNSLQNINVDQLTNLETIGEHAFKDCSNLKAFVVPNSVTSIGAGALAGCDSLESLTVPFVGGAADENTYLAYLFDGALATGRKLTRGQYTVENTNVPSSLRAVNVTNATAIGGYAFACCENIKYILVNDEITSFGSYAFYGCISLKDMVFPESLEILNTYCFSHCDSLVEVELPDSIEEISSSAFSYCHNLEYVSAENVYDLGANAFRECVKLESFYLDSLDMIGNGAFYGCESLTSLALTNALTMVGSNAFSNCTGLVNVTLPESVRSIGGNAFTGCTNLKTFTANCPTAYFSEGPLFGCPNLTTITVPLSGTMTIFSVMGTYTLPESLKTINITEGVTTLANSAFMSANLEHVESINFPSTMTAIGPNAFSYVHGITSFVVPEGITTIKNSAFNGSGLVYIYLPSTLTTIEQYAFAANQLKHLVIPASVTSIASSILNSVSTLESLEVPFIGSTTEGTDDKEFISYYWGQLSHTGNERISNVLKTVTIGSGKDYIPSNAFYFARFIENIVIKEGVTTIKTMAFENCYGLKSVTFPESLETIETLAFEYCSDLESLNIPDGCTNVEYKAFLNCTSLKSVSLSLQIVDNYTYNLLTPSTDDPTDSDGNNGDTWLNSYNGNYFYKMNDKWHYIGCVRYMYGSNDSWFSYDIPSSSPVVSDTRPSVTGMGNHAWFEPSTGNYYWLKYENNSNHWELKGNIQYGCFSYMFGGEMCVTSKLENIVIRSASSIPDSLFADLEHIKHVTLPEEVTKIGENAFKNCNDLESVNIPENVNAIGAYAFYNCNSLESINVPDGVTRIEDYAFYGCSSLTSFAISDHVTYVGEYSLAGCSSLASLVIPEFVNEIGYGALQGCSSLESLVLPFVGKNREINADYSYVGYIFGGRKFDLSITGNYLQLLSGVNNLKVIVLTGANDTGHDILPDYAFAGFSNLEYILLPEDLTSIGAYAFRDCEGLTSFVVADSVTSIGKGAFMDCDNLESIVLPFIGSGSLDTDEQYFAWIFDGAKFDLSGIFEYTSVSTSVPEKLQTVVIKNNRLTTIGSIYESAFAYCSNIKTISINISYTSIEDYAFMGCTGLTNFELANTVTTIGAYAFAGCNGWDITKYYEGEGAPIVNSDIVNSTWYIDVDTGAIYILEEGVWEQGIYDIAKHKLEGWNEPYDDLGEDGDYGYWNWSIYRKYNGTWHTVYNAYPRDSKDDFGADGYLKRIYIDRSTMKIYFWDRFSSSYAEGNLGTYITGHGAPAQPTTGAEVSALYGNFYIDLDGTQVLPSGDRAYLYYLHSTEWEAIDLPVRVGHGSNAEKAIRVDAEGDHYLDTLTNTLYVFKNGEWVLEQNVMRTGSDMPLLGNTNGNAGEYYYCQYDDGYTTFKQLYVRKNNGIESLVIPYGVTTISGSFVGCSSLKYVVIPNTVTTIGDETFQGCTNLTAVTIPSSVTTIGQHAFEGCGLTSIVIPSSVANIGFKAFADCKSLASVDFANGSTPLAFGNNDLLSDASVFSGCTNLKTVYLPNRVTFVGNNLFAHCTSLETIVFAGSNDLVIKGGAFRNMTSLKTLVIPQANTVYRGVINGCTNLETITLPFFGETASSTSNWFGFLIGDLDNDNIKTYNIKHVEIKGGIEMRSFYLAHCDKIETVVLPSSLTTIGNTAFQECSSLTNIDLPEGVLTIGSMAFNDCTGLTNVVIPHSVTSLGQGLFKGCNNLESLTLPFTGNAVIVDNGTRHIGYLFVDESNGVINDNQTLPASLKTIILTDGNGDPRTYLPYEAFDGCLYIEHIELPNVLTYISGYAFRNCDSLRTINIPDSVAFIDEYAFAECDKLREIVLPESLERLSLHAFENDKRLTTVVLPEGLTEIKDYAFQGCSKLTNIDLSNIASYGVGVFKDCSSLANVNLSENLESITTALFANCTSLSAIYIPNSVTSIGDEAFANCTSLATIRINIANLTFIDRDSFLNCESVATVIVCGTGGATLSDRISAYRTWCTNRNITSTRIVALYYNEAVSGPSIAGAQFIFKS